MDADALVRCSATELVAAVRARQVSASAVVRAFLDRTDRIEPRLNTCVTRTDELALQAAHRVDARIAEGHDPGALAGLPVSVKDLIAVGGVRQTFGSWAFADHVAREDASAVARLRAAGACITGKTTTSELGSKAVGDAPLTGITRNPWNPARTPGGSSAGAAAGVAAGLVPAALGTDGGGSLRIPASFCGLVGFKATFGRVPVWPASATPALAHVGPLARSVADCALLMSVIAGHDARDPGSLALPVPDYAGAAAGPDPSPTREWRIGWCENLGPGRATAEVQEHCRRALDPLVRAGCTVVTLDPVFGDDPAIAWNAEFYAGIASRLPKLDDDASIAARIDPALRRMMQASQALGEPERARAAALKRAVRQRVDALFDRIDLLATPATPTSAPPVGVDAPAGHEGRGPVDWSYFTYPFNLTGHPALSLPVGLGADGLPIGLQLVAAPRNELALLLAARAIERAHGFGLAAIDRT
ncbi:amidase [Variovorax sp. PBL-E5]|uniref:amidase n=1 Tax=Variovorax sp. PBL-E5 TaxID=434014 RepID=UPI001316FE7E|nr:amidase family protein [Variovorax sp. PBL-E5]VTU39009.1 Glutamyl-tRNA(Gln) amidotransferase subunit A [Variovorax sp. PBL-E5]